MPKPNKMMMEKPLCDEMREAAMDMSTMIFHSRADWGFGVRVMQPYSAPRDQLSPYGGGLIDELYFCPWSGNLLPKDLDEEWIDEIQKVLGVEEYDLETHLELTPPEFFTDEWWRSRGLVPEARDPNDPEIPKPSDKPFPYITSAYDQPPGFRRSKEAPPHLCERAARKFSDVRMMIAYIPSVREYGFRIVELDEPIDDQPIRIRPFWYCPWCGTKLPTSLRTEWLERLDLLGLDESSEEIPPDLASDTWWRQEGY